jgi:hypothetical protein
MVAQLEPSTSPMFAQVALIWPCALTPAPGKVRKVDAMLPLGRLLVECSCVIPTDCSVGGVVTNGFVGKEGKDLILPDGAAQAAANLVEAALIPSKPRSPTVPGSAELGPL